MFRNCRPLIFVGLALVAFAATPTSSPAFQPPPVVSTSQYHRYFVEFLAGGTARVVGPYRSHKHAHAVAHSLRLQGFSARVVRR
jgi:hypothetical protein